MLKAIVFPLAIAALLAIHSIQLYNYGRASGRSEATTSLRSMKGPLLIATTAEQLQAGADMLAGRGGGTIAVVGPGFDVGDSQVVIGAAHEEWEPYRGEVFVFAMRESDLVPRLFHPTEEGLVAAREYVRLDSMENRAHRP